MTNMSLDNLAQEIANKKSDELAMSVAVDSSGVENSTVYWKVYWQNFWQNYASALIDLKAKELSS